MAKKLSKEEQNQSERHEKKMRKDVEKLKAVDEMGGKDNEISKSLEKARKYFKAIKEARGEKYDKDDIKEIKIPEDTKKSGNNKKAG